MNIESDTDSTPSLKDIPKVDTFQRTQNYVNEQDIRLKNQSENIFKFHPYAEVFLPRNKDMHTQDNAHCDIPVTYKQNPNTDNYISSQHNSDLSELYRFLLKKDLLMSRFIRFSDRPE